MITIKEGIVKKDGIQVGTVMNFCCGVDFRIDDRPKALFSILSVKMGSYQLKKCVTVLLSLEIPEDLNCHMNFKHEIATNARKIKSFQKLIYNYKD